MNVDFGAALEHAERAQAVSDLKAARTQLLTRGWADGDYMTPDGRVCALGAIGAAVVEQFDELDRKGRAAEVHCNKRVRRAARFLAGHLEDVKAKHGRRAETWTDHEVVWRFNDADETTGQDVLNLFEKALADLGGLG